MDGIGTILAGDRLPNCELNEAARSAIYSLHSAGHSKTALALRFGVHRNTIYRTIKRFEQRHTFVTKARIGLEKHTADG